MSCVQVGSTNADISGLGVILAFAIQGGISLVLSAWSICLQNLLETGPWSPPLFKILGQKLGMSDSKRNIYRIQRCRIDKVLATAADAQVLTGIALLLSSLIQNKSLDLYHYHIIYDTVNFTGVSFCAAILTSFSHEEEKRKSRLIAIGFFSILYLAFTITFGIHLGRWNFTTPGSCYNTRLIAASNAKHPMVDQVYLGITCLYMFVTLSSSIGAEKSVDEMLKKLQRRQQDLQPEPPKLVQDMFAATTAVRNWLREIQLEVPGYIQDLLAPTMGAVGNSLQFSDLVVGTLLSRNGMTKEEAAAYDVVSFVLTCALAQYPLHLYSVFALRASNHHLLTGESENTWGFGQIVALVMLAQTFIECFRGVKEYRVERRIILAAESLSSIAHHLKPPTDAEAV